MNKKLDEFRKPSPEVFSRLVIIQEKDIPAVLRKVNAYREAGRCDELSWHEIMVWEHHTGRKEYKVTLKKIAGRTLKRPWYDDY